MQPLFIGPYQLGVQKDLKPFMIPDTAFPELENAFVFRGRVERKPGYRLLGRLRLVISNQVLGVTDGSGAFTGTGPTSLLNIATAIDAGATIAPGSITITVTGAPNQVFTEPAVPNGTLVKTSPALPPASGTIDYLTGIFTIQTNPVLAGAAVTVTFGYYPNLPVMGIRTREQPTLTNQEATIFFDTKYAYRFQNGQFEELPSTLPVTWSGTDAQFFWSTNFQFDQLNNNLFWETNNKSGLHAYQVTLFGGAAAGPPSTVNVTTSTANNFQVGDTVAFTNLAGAGSANNLKFGTVTLAGNPFTISNPATGPGTGYFSNGAVTGIVAASRLISQNLAGQDGIRIYNGTTWGNFNPIVNATSVLTGCLMLIPYKGRMVALNTQEGSNTAAPVSFRQRARWSQNGSAINQATGWDDVTPGRGGFVDAPTNESIVAAGFVKDQLIVFFERSAWALVYTGNEILPFIFQRIDSQLGASSTFSSVAFDNGLITFGNVGVHSSNGQICQRIDQVIPDEIFQVKASGDGPTRTYGIRDYVQEMVMWAYADDEDNSEGGAGKVFYPNKVMCYNYRNNTFSTFDDHVTCFGYFQDTPGVPWSGMNDFPWSAWTSPWNAGLFQSEFQDIAFGNQQGFVNIITSAVMSNDKSLYIKSVVLNATNTQITSPQHNLFEGQYVHVTGMQGVTGLNDLTFLVTDVTDENTFLIDGVGTGTYAGGGTLTVLSNILIQTKQFTPFWEKGKRYELRYIDMLFDRTSTGELTVNVYADFNTLDSMTQQNTVLKGRNAVSTSPEGTTLPYYSFQQLGDQIWKRFYTSATGETFQLELTFDDTQMRTIPINYADVVLHGLIFYFNECGEFY